MNKQKTLTSAREILEEFCVCMCVYVPLFSKARDEGNGDGAHSSGETESQAPTPTFPEPFARTQTGKQASKVMCVLGVWKTQDQ